MRPRPRSAAGGEREPATLVVDAHGNEDSTESLAFTVDMRWQGRPARVIGFVPDAPFTL